MIIIIAAMDPHGVIAIDGRIPWHYSEDFKRFKVLTMGCTVIMGRKTWESLPKALPGRRNVVLSRQATLHTPVMPDLVAAPPDLGKFLHESEREPRPTFIIGGAEVYRAAFETEQVDEVDLTIVPEVSLPMGEVRHFPVDLLKPFALQSEGYNPLDPRLLHQRYARRV